MKSWLPLLSLLLFWLPAQSAEDRAVQEWVGKVDQWFTVEEAAGIAGQDASVARKEHLRSEKHPITEVVEYAWKSDRTRQTTGAVKMTLPVENSIKVGWLRRTTLRELQDLRSYTTGEDLPGVGEFAFLAAEGKQYIFFKNGVRFSVWVNLSDDPQVNTAKAVEVARLLLAKL